MTNDYTPPDPYAAGLKALRTAAAATSTPEQTFEEQYKAERLRALEGTRAALETCPYCHKSLADCADEQRRLARVRELEAKWEDDSRAWVEAYGR